MKYYNETRPLCLTTYASKVGLGAGLLQVRNRMNCPEDEALHDNTQRLTAFTSKSL